MSLDVGFHSDEFKQQNFPRNHAGRHAALKKVAERVGSEPTVPSITICNFI
jgi:hypothetical protein